MEQEGRVIRGRFRCVAEKGCADWSSVTGGVVVVACCRCSSSVVVGASTN